MTRILQYIWDKFIMICGADKKLMANKDTYQCAYVVISKYALNVDSGWDIDLGKNIYFPHWIDPLFTMSMNKEESSAKALFWSKSVWNINLLDYMPHLSFLL